jgi:hypothetical protein
MWDAIWSDPEAFWLNVANAVLGGIAILALLSIVGAAAIELFGRLRKRGAKSSDTRIHRVPGLGLTMADGGEEINKKDAGASRK